VRPSLAIAIEFLSSRVCAIEAEHRAEINAIKTNKKRRMRNIKAPRVRLEDVMGSDRSRGE
jgi:hypothetical protein